MLPSSGHFWKQPFLLWRNVGQGSPYSFFFSLRAAFFSLPLVPGFVETHFQMCQSHSVSWSRISVFQLLSKTEEILRKENVSPQPPGSSAQRPSMLCPFHSALPCVFEETTSDRERWIGRVVFPSFLVPRQHWTPLCNTTWYCLEGHKSLQPFTHTRVAAMLPDRCQTVQIRNPRTIKGHFVLLPLSFPILWVTASGNKYNAHKHT